MGTKTQLLCARLREAADLLERSGERNWQAWLEESLRRIENSDFSGIEQLLGAFGGMGSFNDLVLSSANGDSISDSEYAKANARLNELRRDLYELANNIRHHADIASC